MHWGLNASAYCHASSPIRRWADCINQIALREEILGYSKYILTPPTQDKITGLNERAKRAKAFERDVCFARLLLQGSKLDSIDAIVVEVSTTKTKLWVPKWNRMISSKQVDDSLPGHHVAMHFYADPTQRSWKRRVVVQFNKA
jgi:exoribonuclease R